jgi:tRNA1(Val) A37 N6-methylase TrmN6
MRPEVTDDAALGGRLRLLQPRKGHRFGHDAILLAAATGAKPGDHVVDLGAGVGTAGLAVAARVPGIDLTLVEIDPDLAALARENLERNGFADRSRVVCSDAASGQQILVAADRTAGFADAVLANPPFNDPTTQTSSPDPRRWAAHVGPRGLLSDWIRTAALLLRRGGMLTLIFQAERLAELQSALSPPLNPQCLLWIRGRPQAPAIRVIVRAVKDEPATCTELPELVLSDAAGRPSAQAELVLRDAATLIA